MSDTVRNSIFTYSIFWTVSLFVLFRIFTKEYFSGTVDYIYTAIFHIPLFIVVTIHIKLINNFLFKRNYLVYLISFIGLCILGVVLHYFIFDIVAPIVLNDFYFISMPNIEIAQFILAYLLVSLLLTLSKKSFELREKQHELETENNQTQLTNLKAQLNPHFLFNSLNNIYSITGKENKEARNYIIKLSDALRYMLYKTGSETVLLSDEVDYLDNYVELEKLRMESDAKITFIKSNSDRSLRIAPLILLPFIENCFKHCDKSDAYINIELKTKNNMLLLTCENNKTEREHKDGGIGLVNSKKRLELIYPNKYDLQIKESEVMYESILKIELR